MDDDYVAQVMAKEARENSQKYSMEGLGAYMPQKRTGNVPKANTRFLRHLIKETDNHNTALKRKEERDSRDRMRQLEEPRRDQISKRRSEDAGRHDRERHSSARDSERRHRDDRRHGRHGDRRSDRDDDRGDRRDDRHRDRDRSHRKSYRDRSRSASSERDRSRRHRRKDNSRSQSKDTDRDKERRHRRREGDRDRSRERDRDREHRRRRRRSRSRSHSHKRERSESRPTHHRRRSYSESRSRSPRRDRNAGPRRDRSHRKSPSRMRSPHSHKTEPRRSGHEEDTRSSREPKQNQHNTVSSKPRHDDGEESDPLEDMFGPAPPQLDGGSDAPIRSRGRGAYKPNSSNIDSHFAPDYDPTLDLRPDEDEALPNRPARRPVAGLMTEEDDWDMALEALRDRARWKQKGEERLREAGLNESIIERWKDNTVSTGADGEKKPEDVRWSKKGEGREWDRGKVMDQDGHTDVHASW